MPRRRRVVWLDERGAPSGDGYRDSARFPADRGPTGPGVRAWTPCRHVCGLPARRESARASTAGFGGASAGGVGGPLGGVEARRGCSLARDVRRRSSVHLTHAHLQPATTKRGDAIRRSDVRLWPCSVRHTSAVHRETPGYVYVYVLRALVCLVTARGCSTRASLESRSPTLSQHAGMQARPTRPSRPRAAQPTAPHESGLSSIEYGGSYATHVRLISRGDPNSDAEAARSATSRCAGSRSATVA